MSVRELVILGTNSQAPTRNRGHQSLVLRFDEQMILFDPGENTQRQAILAGVNINRLTGICITHFHGDHCLGLPGVIQRRSLHNSTNETDGSDLPIYFPAEGAEFYNRLATCSAFYDSSLRVAHPILNGGFQGTVGSLRLTAHPLDHRIATFGYRLDEPASLKLNKTALVERSLSGPLVGELIRQGAVTVAGRTTVLEEVSEEQAGQSMAFVMDTSLCDGAVELSEGVDVLVCESTFADSEAALASKYKHLTAGQAGRLAADAGAKRLVLTHFSARYNDLEVLKRQAETYHDDVVIAEDLQTIPFPKRH